MCFPERGANTCPPTRQCEQQLLYLACCLRHDIKAANVANKFPLTSTSNDKQTRVRLHRSDIQTSSVTASKSSANTPHLLGCLKCGNERNCWRPCHISNWLRDQCSHAIVVNASALQPCWLCGSALMEANILMIEETSLFSVIMLMRALRYFTVYPLTPDKALHHRRDRGLTRTRRTAGSADDPETHTGGLKGSQHRNFASVLGVRGRKMFDSEIPCEISALGRVLHVYKAA